MAKGDNLGEFEVLNLAAVFMLGDNAYGMTIHEQVEELAEGTRSVSLGSVYTTLDRLEQKGYVKSWFSDPTPERGGRSKRYFEITGAGEKAMKRSLKVAANMVAGLRGIGGVV
jgi:PadR family transcriptional regulator PadR